MTAPPWCPVCFGELVVSGADLTEAGTTYSWRCPYCDAPREPAGTDEAPAEAA
jgi:hypothetical protein